MNNLEPLDFDELIKACKDVGLDAAEVLREACINKLRGVELVEVPRGADVVIIASNERQAKTMSEPTTRESILDAAKQCVCTDREGQYGSPEDNFTLIAKMWSEYLRATGLGDGDDSRDLISAEDVAVMMCLLKIARIATGEPKADSWIDLAGYAACGGEIQGRRSNE